MTLLPVASLGLVGCADTPNGDCPPALFELLGDGARGVAAADALPAEVRSFVPAGTCATRFEEDGATEVAVFGTTELDLVGLGAALEAAGYHAVDQSGTASWYSGSSWTTSDRRVYAYERPQDADYLDVLGEQVPGLTYALRVLTS